MADFKDHAKAATESASAYLRQACSDALSAALQRWEETVPKANIEEFYILADVVTRLDADEVSEPPPFQFLASRVQYLIAKTLEVDLRGSPLTTHQSFVQKVWNRANRAGDDVSVITLNWDILLDQAADLEVGYRQRDLGWNRVFDREFNRVPRAPHGFGLYKMHGSLNWWFCPECRALRYKTDEKDILDYWERPEPLQCGASDCTKRGTRLRPLMTPPTSQKLESTPEASILKHVWRSARKRLAHCEELVLVGYSFPPTDIQFKMFVMEALAANDDLKMVRVVSNRKKKMETRKFQTVYRAIFASTRNPVEVAFDFDGFEEWVENDCPC